MNLVIAADVLNATVKHLFSPDFPGILEELTLMAAARDNTFFVVSF